MSFHEQLKKARQAKGLTQQEVADLMGITSSTYCGYETGKRQPDTHKIRKLAEILGVSADVLLEVPAASTKVDDNDIKFALFGGAGEITDEMFEDVRKFAEFVKQREAEKQNKK